MEILMLEDDRIFGSLVQKYLQRHGHRVVIYDNLKNVLDEEAYRHFEVIVLDLMLGETHGIDLVRALKAKGAQVPLLVLSGVNESDAKIALIRAGADDYVTKPMNPAELLARIEAVYRRYVDARLPEVQDFGAVKFFWQSFAVERDGRRIELSAKETALLRILVRNNGRAVSEVKLLEEVWGEERRRGSNVLQSLVRRLRTRLDREGERPLIESVYGIGYKFSI